jgi:hypothetical protein
MPSWQARSAPGTPVRRHDRGLYYWRAIRVRHRRRAWAWTGFAASLGALPVTVVPVLGLLTGFTTLLVVGNNMVTAAAASIAARTKPAATQRAG